jgi:Ca2+-binding EF-hand superfamily protein
LAKRKLTRRGVPPDRRQRFDQFDRNHDGVLSGDEFRDFMADLDQRVARRAQLNFMRTDPVLDALDINHDGEISASEIRNAVESLKSLDRDHDGTLRLPEVVPEPVAREVAILFRMDVDFDGRISQAETENPFGQRARNLLEAADRNGDGFVTWDELAYEIRLRADLNHDGVVTWQEMMLARKSGVLYGPGREQRKRVRV